MKIVGASRRAFLRQFPAACLALPAAATAAGSERMRRPKVAAIFTVLRFRSHAFNILENMLGPYLFRGEQVEPRIEIASMYADQFPEDDMTRDVARRFRIPLYDSIDKALCLGTDQLAVDAVLSIGEHGDYPQNEWGQTLYPRKRFFDEALATMQRSGRYVPFFNDKHLSYRWDWSLEMYETARQRGFPMLAGSSVPLAERRPNWDLRPGVELTDALAIHGGGFESYDFHGLEVLQSFVESRRGGETGIASVEFLAGDAFARAAGRRWPQALVDAAMDAEAKLGSERQPRPSTGVFAPRLPTGSKGADRPVNPSPPYAICVAYRDGLRGTMLALGGGSDRWSFACQVKGDASARATAMFNGPWGNRCLFMALTHAIQHTFATGTEPYPLERTLLTTGMVEAAVRSFHENRAVNTPQLTRAYRSPDWSPFRENGASWRVLTAADPQPAIIERNRFSRS